MNKALNCKNIVNSENIKFDYTTSNLTEEKFLAINTLYKAISRIFIKKMIRNKLLSKKDNYN